MRRLIFAIVLLSSVAVAQTYQRPTTDSNAAVNNGCLSGLNQGSSSMSGTYSGKTGAGPVNTTHGTAVVTSPAFGSSFNWTGRVFSGFTMNKYTAYALHVSAACANDTSNSASYGRCAISYSTNGGSTWTSLTTVASGTTQTTFSVSLGAITNLNLLQVTTCARASYYATSGDPTTETMTVYDIWTAGTPAPTAANKVSAFLM